MPQYTLKNNQLEITVNSHGAELVSLRDVKTQTEYMWEGSPSIWGRVSPVLFPFVGGLKNKEYTYNHKKYPMTQHGFARDMEFELTLRNDNSLWLRLKSNEMTLAKYPFDFCLEIGYELQERDIKVLWKVTNPADTKLYFSIGGHPGFVCPLHEQEKLTDCYIGFENAASITSSVIDTNAGLLSSVKKTYSLDSGLLAITPGLFDQDALVIEHNQVQQVSLLSADKTPYLSVSFDAPLFGVWSMPHKQAPYICIEPWYGRCDSVDFDDSLEDRDWGNVLEGGKVFDASYTIHIYPTL